MSYATVRIAGVYLWSGIAGLLVLGGACNGGHNDGDALDPARDAGIAACDRYLQCAVATTPSAVGPLIESYGAEGACWATDSRQAIELCTAACEQARAGVFMAYPDEVACGDCSNEFPCLAEDTVCDPATFKCVECVNDGHCGGSRSHCAAKVCVECVSDEHCGAAAKCVEQRCEDLAKVCEPGEKRCSDDRLEVCDANGVAWTLLEGCTSKGLVCDPGALACAKEVVCTPKQDFCTFNAESGRADVRTCNADGTGSVFKADCVGKGQTCYQGACVTTEYGPCIQGNTACLVAGDECQAIEDIVGGLHFVCSGPCSDGCAEALPPGAPGYSTCWTGQCMLGCEGDNACPPGMACNYDSVSAACTWET